MNEKLHQALKLLEGCEDLHRNNCKGYTNGVDVNGAEEADSWACEHYQDVKEFLAQFEQGYVEKESTSIWSNPLEVIAGACLAAILLDIIWRCL